MTDGGIQAFLDDYPDEVASLARSIRQRIIDTAEDPSETLHLGWKVIGYRRKKAFCAIAPHGKWVNLQFHAGASLADPEGLLQGTGKSMRHVKLMPGDELGADLDALIREAAALAD